MKYEIKNYHTGEVLFSLELNVREYSTGLFSCVEAAVRAGVNLAGADLMHVNLNGANLEGAHLAGAYLTGANLVGANLMDADLEGAYLSGAYLMDANLAGANLMHVNLAGAYLMDANLYGAYLMDANLTGGRIRRRESRRYGARMTTKLGAHMSGLFCPICCKEHDIEADDGELDFAVIFVEEASGELIEKAVCVATGVILGYRKLESV